MTNIAQLRDWLDSLKMSAPFVIVLPFVVSTVLAAFAWRFERSLTASRRAASRDMKRQARDHDQDAGDLAEHR